MTLPSWAFDTIKILGVGLCLYLAYVSGKWGLADYYADRSYRLIRTWERTTPTNETWHEALGPLERALSLDATNPTYNHRMGRLYHIRMSLDPLNRHEWGQSAKEYFRKSIDVRPMWPLTWASYALVKADLLEYDDQLNEAIIKATQYGQWEPGVHQIISAIGSRGLGRFPKDVQAAIVVNDARGIISPVGGAPARVIRNLAKYSEADRALMMPVIGEELFARSWDDHRGLTFANVTLEFWPYFTPDQQGEIVRRVVAIPDTAQVMRVADQYGRLAALCPWVPRGPDFDGYCSNQRLGGM